MEISTAVESKEVVGKRPNRLLKNILQYKYVYLMILPGMAFIILFNYVPVYGLMLAFKEFKFNLGILGSPWNNFENFKYLMRDADFWIAFKNTIIISFGKIIFGFPVPIILAILLNELKNQRFKRTIQSVLYLPHFLSWIIMAGIIYNLLSVTDGTVAKILDSVFHIEQPVILGNPDYFRPLVFISDIWKAAGWGTIIYLAAIAGIDPSLYEASIIDGANRFKQIMYITIPCISYAIVILLILTIGGIMNAGFDQIFNLYDAGVYNVGDILDTYVYRVGISGAGSGTVIHMEYGVTVGLFKSVINCSLLVFANRISKLFGNEGVI